MARFCSIPFSDFSSSNVIPVMYDKNAGYSGRVHGEMKLKNPAPKAKNTLISDPIFLFAPYIYCIHRTKNQNKSALLVCERFMAK